MRFGFAGARLVSGLTEAPDMALSTTFWAALIAAALIGAAASVALAMRRRWRMLGATLVVQAPVTAITRTFSPGVYSGTVGMEVTFP